ncbi:hypothetical protein ABT213_32385 [Streptomyces sp. NPDC001674]|uniref:hypothetical protein n=1 Tax=Streptomyces sp. NPDC001674 TaxID=3154394 RepID=UPI0033331C5F
MVFRDPAQHLRVGGSTGIPKPVPSDLLANALRQTKTTLGRLVLVLAAVHAVHVHHELRTILTCDLDLARGPSSSAAASDPVATRAYSRRRTFRGSPGFTD